MTRLFRNLTDLATWSLVAAVAASLLFIVRSKFSLTPWQIGGDVYHDVHHKGYALRWNMPFFGTLRAAYGLTTGWAMRFSYSAASVQGYSMFRLYIGLAVIHFSYEDDVPGASSLLSSTPALPSYA